MNTIIFDLDGTLLPMNQDKFFKEYFRALAKNMSVHGYQPEELIKISMAGNKGNAFQ
jgi:phosphoglycolate phosphatase-like HAD superfamily hydrolase